MPPMLVDTSNGCKYVGQSGSAAMLAVKRSAGVTPEVNLRNSMQARKHASESTLALKPRADVTRSPKQGYQWPHKKHMCPPKIWKKEVYIWECAPAPWANLCISSFIIIYNKNLRGHQQQVKSNWAALNRAKYRHSLEINPVKKKKIPSFSCNKPCQNKENTAINPSQKKENSAILWFKLSHKSKYHNSFNKPSQVC